MNLLLSQVVTLFELKTYRPFVTAACEIEYVLNLYDMVLNLNTYAFKTLCLASNLKEDVKEIGPF